MTYWQLLLDIKYTYLGTRLHSQLECFAFLSEGLEVLVQALSPVRQPPALLAQPQCATVHWHCLPFMG